MNKLNVLNEWGLAQAPATTPPSPLVDSLVGSGLGVVAGSALGAFLGHTAIGAVAGGLFGAAGGYYYSTLNAVPPPPAPPPPTAPVTAGVTPPAAPSCTTLKPGVMPVVTVSTSNPTTYQYCLPTGATLVSAAPANVGQGQGATDINVDSSAFAADGQIAVSAWSTSAAGNASAVIQWTDADGVTARTSTIPVSVES